MRATRLPKLLLKALRIDQNAITNVPLNFEKIPGQTANFIEVRDVDGIAVLWSVGPSGAPGGVSTLGKYFYAPAQTGTGAAQNIAHGLGVVPRVVLVIPTTGGTATFTKDATNIVVTCTSAGKYDVMAWA